MGGRAAKVGPRQLDGSQGAVSPVLSGFPPPPAGRLEWEQSNSSLGSDSVLATPRVSGGAWRRENNTSFFLYFR